MTTKTHLYAGTSPDRQSVGLPGHCGRCAVLGHVIAHPDFGCADVGCTSGHGSNPDEDREFDARTILAQRGITLELGREFTLEQIEELAEVVKNWEA